MISVLGVRLFGLSRLEKNEKRNSRLKMDDE